MTDIDALIQRAANHLAGEPVIIRWRDPAAEGALGQAHKTATGAAVVDIANLTSVETTFRVLLHELAHIRLGHAVYTGAVTKPPASIPRNEPRRAAWRVDTRETAANELAARWLAYAEKQGGQILNNHLEASPLECYLRALLTWRE